MHLRPARLYVSAKTMPTWQSRNFRAANRQPGPFGMLIAEHWDDILRFVATIKLKETTASQLFKRLNSYSKQHPLWQALKEFGKIIKTRFILRYLDNVAFH